MCINTIRIMAICLAAVLVLRKQSYAKDSKTRNWRVAHGRPVPIGLAPWVAQIKTRHERAFVCGGTIVSAWHVVSAAHCFDAYRKDQLIVIVAEEHLVRLPHGEYHNAVPKKRNIAAIYRHPRYKRNSALDADVAVVKVRAHLNNGANSRIIPLCKRPVQSTDVIEAVGWSNNEVMSKIESNQLMKITLLVMPADECRDVYRNTTHVITDSMFCSAVFRRPEVCQVGTGGPVIRDGALCGIVSRAVSSGRDSYPGVFISIPAVVDFITACLDNKCREKA